MAVAALLLVFPVLMAFAGASDLLTMTIPNRVSIVLVAAFGLMAALGGLPAPVLLLHLAAAALVLVVTFGMFAAGWIGGGDAKLAAATALWLGFGALPDYFIFAALAGGALTLSIMAMRRWPLPRFAHRWTWLARIHDPASGVPYGIALAGAALAVYPQTELWTAVLAR